MIRIAVCSSLTVALVLFAFAVDVPAQTVIAGTVKSKAGKPLPGLVLLEKGEIHNNVWALGAPVGRPGPLPDRGGRGRLVRAPRRTRA